MEKTSIPSPEEERKSADLTGSSSEIGETEPPTEIEVEVTEKEKEYPKGFALAGISLGLCLAVFVIALDQTIIATAIPKITDQFNSLEDVGWYASAYLLTTGALQLLYGRLYSTFSIKWVFIAALSIFELGSLICAAAPSSLGLIIGRAIAGVGAAGLFSGALIILANVVPLRSRPTYMGLLGGMFGIASVAGPLLGGVFTDKITWRLCFYINLPVGLITVLAIVLLYKEHERAAIESIGWKARMKTFDPTGNIILIPAIISLFLGLQWGGIKYPWGSARIIALLVVFGVLISAFVAVQFWKPENAMVPPRLLRMRSVWAACAFNFFIAGQFFITSFYLPIWFQAVKGVSAVQSGIMNIPLILGVVAASMVAGLGTTIIGYYTPFMYFSTVVMCIGGGMLTTFTIHTGSPAWIGWQAMTGLGMGLGMQLPMIAVQAVLPADDIPTGTALVVFMQTIGGAIFVSVGQSIFTNKLVENLHRFVPDLDASLVLGTGATKIHKAYEGLQLQGIRLAYNDALTQTFLVGVVVGALTAVGSLAMEWTSVKEKKTGDPVEGSEVAGSGDEKVTSA